MTLNEIFKSSIQDERLCNLFKISLVVPTIDQKIIFLSFFLTIHILHLKKMKFAHQKLSFSFPLKNKNRWIFILNL